MLTIGSEVLRKTGTDARKGIIVAITKPNEYARKKGDIARVKWVNSTNRINGNKDTHTSVQLDALMPYSENAVKFRQRANQVKHAERNMKDSYKYFEMSTTFENQLHHAINLVKAEFSYSRLVNGNHTYGKCEACQKVRVLTNCLCGACGHRRARAINTKEMYGKGRRGY